MEEETGSELEVVLARPPDGEEVPGYMGAGPEAF